MSSKIKVDIWSDVQCPWCYIGKRKFESGVAQFLQAQSSRDGGGSVEVEVEYHSFELSPETPVDFEGSTIDYLSERKGMPREQVQAMLAQVTDIARNVGLSYDFDAVKQTNTVRAHQVLHYAKQHGLQLPMKERLLKAYFEEGRHVGDPATLAELAAEVGLDADDVLRSLAADEFRDAVWQDQQQANEYGIQGVPFFVIDGKYGVSGAQEAAAFAQVLEQVSAEKAPA